VEERHSFTNCLGVELLDLYYTVASLVKLKILVYELSKSCSFHCHVNVGCISCQKHDIKFLCNLAETASVDFLH